MKLRIALFCAAAVFSGCAAPAGRAAEPAERLQQVVSDAVRPIMRKDAIPGMAIGVTVGGKVYVFNYGVASRRPSRNVARDTLFEIGSVSKTFTATLASYAQATHRLSLSDRVAAYLPALKGSAFGNVTLLELGTHTPGGLPLQVPDDVQNDAQLIRYFKHWRPAYAPGTVRTYSNPGIGTLGLIAAKSMGEDFTRLAQRRLFPVLGLTHTFIDVPPSRISDYAWGYRDGKPVRMTAGELGAEAYGVKSTAADMTRFLQANMNELQLPRAWQAAITGTHTAYFHAEPLTQDLIWEQYRYPVALERLLAGNSPHVIFKPVRAVRLVPPEPPGSEAWLNKTGSTNGFGAYVAFVPEKHAGIVILANENYPIADRVTIAYRVLAYLAGARADQR